MIVLRNDFQVPPDDERFEVLAADGALYLQAYAPCYDVLLVDGFDLGGQPAGLCSQPFYDDCLAALPDGGVLVVNLHYDHPDYALLVGRIRRSFGGNAVEIVTLDNSNSIVFARKGAPISPQGLRLADSLVRLDARARAILKPELARMLWQMKSLDTGDDG